LLSVSPRATTCTPGLPTGLLAADRTARGFAGGGMTARVGGAAFATGDVT
jgi:hypothetical protein